MSIWGHPDAKYDLLGGAARARTRVRGFAPWQPRGATRNLLDQVLAVLDEYADYLPLTLRQIFYRLVGAHGYEKTERAYGRLGEHLNRARRSRLIPMADIRDDGGQCVVPVCWASADDFLQTVRETAANMRLDRTAGQDTRLAVICEAAGMVPQLARVANEYGIMVRSRGGFDSTTVRHELAEAATADERTTEYLHIGDHDPSGVHVFLAFAEDIVAFARELGASVRFTRLAVTPEQIRALGLPTAPPKSTDRRAFAGDTSQAEAIPPDVLAQILRNAIEDRLDQEAYRRVLEQERETQRELVRRLRRA
jgi:hypothetical protein